MRQLRKPVRKERRRQKLKRWSGNAYFLLEQVSAKPTHVQLVGTDITPLWETDKSGPNDLDLRHPLTVSRRFTLGQMWYFRHDYDNLRVPIVLVVDEHGDAWLIAPKRKRFPATAEGWQRLVLDVGSNVARHRGGLWQGSG
jgi:hypothetical protein